MAYNERIIDHVLDELIPSLPAILLDGPKAVGKSTTALQRVKAKNRFCSMNGKRHQRCGGESKMLLT